MALSVVGGAFGLSTHLVGAKPGLARRLVVAALALATLGLAGMIVGKVVIEA